jgi:hypothetical protein
MQSGGGPAGSVWIWSVLTELRCCGLSVLEGVELCYGAAEGGEEELPLQI